VSFSFTPTSWSGMSMELMWASNARPLCTPWSVHIFHTIAQFGMWRWNMLKIFITCLQNITLWPFKSWSMYSPHFWWVISGCHQCTAHRINSVLKHHQLDGKSTNPLYTQWTFLLKNIKFSSCCCEMTPQWSWWVCMRNFSIPNTPHPCFQQLVLFEVLNEMNNIWETCF
jgi:hypothetical protein